MSDSPDAPLQGTEVPDGQGLRLPDRLPVLDRGAHSATSGKACAMEAASWIAGERWSDHPRSVHRAIASVARWVNDAVDDEERQRLWPLILASLDTGKVHGFRLDRNLRRLTREAGCRAVAKGRPTEAWREVLRAYGDLTGHQARDVRPERIAELSDHLGEAARS
jgi:hypothetical protein